MVRAHRSGGDIRKLGKPHGLKDHVNQASRAARSLPSVDGCLEGRSIDPKSDFGAR